MEPENLSSVYNRETLFRRSLRWCGAWEQILLIGLLLMMVVMVASLLWPKPQAKITLKPYVAADTIVSVPDESSIEVSEDAQFASAEKPTARKSHRRKHAATARKKPEHPPVLNLNQAAYAQLQLLPGIGPKMAQRVIEYRKANGGFKTIEQIMEVKGIGPKKFEKMKPYLKL